MSIGLIQRRQVHPWAALRQAERAFEQMQRRPLLAVAALRRFEPQLQAHETEAGWEVTAELPGVARDDLEIFMQEGVLTIRGARHYGRREAAAEGTTTTEAAENETSANADRPVESADTPVEGADTPVAKAPAALEANVARFERKIRFNGDVDEEGISARYADGVLEVSVPRLVPAPPEVRTIPIQVL